MEWKPWMMEPERARAILEKWLAWPDEELDQCCLSEPMRLAIDELKALRAERAAVVAFLRKWVDAEPWSIGQQVALRDAAAAIERGEHVERVVGE